MKNSNERYLVSIEKLQGNINEIAIEMAWQTYEMPNLSIIDMSL